LHTVPYILILEVMNTGDNYTLGVALTNKKWLKTRSTNQLIGNTREPRRIPSKKHWYTIDPQDT
jgi:hypothetical protein